MLKVNNVTKVFGKGTVNQHTALNNLSIELNDGDFVTIVGSNGAGKSTLFNAICGTFWCDRGKIILDNKDITYKKEHKRARDIGRVFQDTMKGTAPDMTIEENLALAYSKNHTKVFQSAVNEKMRRFFREQLARYDMGLEDRLKNKVGLLSGGQRQVVTLLMCTLSVPKLLLLDEHTAALDPATAEKVMKITKQIVEENSITTMMITHNINQALTTGNRTIMMDSGEIILDIGAEERENMTREDLLNMYSVKKKEALDNDRILFS